MGVPFWKVDWTKMVKDRVYVQKMKTSAANTCKKDTEMRIIWNESPFPRPIILGIHVIFGIFGGMDTLLRQPTNFKPQKMGATELADRTLLTLLLTGFPGPILYDSSIPSVYGCPSQMKF